MMVFHQDLIKFLYNRLLKIPYTISQIIYYHHKFFKVFKIFIFSSVYHHIK